MSLAIGFLLAKVERGELDPYEIDLESLIEDWRKESERLSQEGFFMQAGEFLIASVKLLKLQLEYFFPDLRTEKEKRKITLKEVKEALQVEEDPLGEYFLRVGRKAGSPNRQEKPVSTEPEVEDFTLHKSFSPEEYIKRLEELGLIDWESFKEFFYSIKDPKERVRFFLAWLMLFQT